MNTGLRSRIIYLTELALLSVHRRDIDYSPPASGDHPFNHLLGYVEKARQGGVDHRVPVFIRHLAKHTVTRDTGVIHQYVNLSDLFPDLIKCGDCRFPIADVALGSDEGEAKRGLLGKPFFTTRGIGSAAGHHHQPIGMKTLAY